MRELPDDGGISSSSRLGTRHRPSDRLKGDRIAALQAAQVS
jgi:hypothetical protein